MLFRSPARLLNSEFWCEPVNVWACDKFEQHNRHTRARHMLQCVVKFSNSSIIFIIIPFFSRIRQRHTLRRTGVILNARFHNKRVCVSVADTTYGLNAICDVTILKVDVSIFSLQPSPRSPTVNSVRASNQTMGRLHALRTEFDDNNKYNTEITNGIYWIGWA